MGVVVKPRCVACSYAALMTDFQGDAGGSRGVERV